MPKDAVVRVRSTEIGQKQVTGPGTAELPTGAYDVEANCSGLSAVSARVTINRGAIASWLPWPNAYIDVQAVPAGATVMVDGVERGVSPLVMEVEPGTLHRVEVRKDKYTAYQAEVTAAVGDKMSMTPALALLPGSIRVVTSIAGANVQLDGGARGRTPFVFANVSSGTHTVAIQSVRQGDAALTAGPRFRWWSGRGSQTDVVKEMVRATARLRIKDAPLGSTVQVSGSDVNAEQALGEGVDVPASMVSVVVTGSGDAEMGSNIVGRPGHPKQICPSMT